MVVHRQPLSEPKKKFWPQINADTADKKFIFALYLRHLRKSAAKYS